MAFNKGSNVHYFLVKLLEKNGLKYRTPRRLPAARRCARRVREGRDRRLGDLGSVPAAAEKQAGARQLADATGIANAFNFYLAQSDYAQANPAILKALFDNTSEAARFVQADIPKAAALIAPLQGLDVAVVESSLRRYRYGVVPLTPQVAAEQQKIANSFAKIGLIPKEINVNDAIWKVGS